MSHYPEKMRLLKYFMESRNCFMAVTEARVIGRFPADVLTVGKDGSINEIEIKTKKNDLSGELNTIKKLKENRLLFDGRLKKFLKHRYYFDLFYMKKEFIPRHTIPNKIYFAVNNNCIDTALSILSDTFYGVISLPEIDCYRSPEIISRAKNLYPVGSVDFNKYKEIIRRQSMQNCRYLEKIYKNVGLD